MLVHCKCTSVSAIAIESVVRCLHAHDFDRDRYRDIAIEHDAGSMTTHMITLYIRM
jgi:hypothetical protein